MLLVLLSLAAQGYFDEYDYSKRRIQEMYNLRKNSFSGNISLTDNEAVVDRWCEYLKILDTANWTLNPGGPTRPPGRPHGQAPPWVRYWDLKSRDMVESSSFYQRIVKAMPKGGNLHVHDGARADRMSLIKMFINDPNLYVKDTNDETRGRMAFFVNQKPPQDWTLASKWNLQELEELQMVTNMDYKNDNDKYEVYPWADFGKAYTKFDGFAWYDKVYPVWVNESLNQAIRDNVQYLEIRASFGKLYDKNSEFQPGPDTFTPMDKTGKVEPDIWTKTLNDVRKAYPDYIFDMRAVYQVGRTTDGAHIKGAIDKARSLQQTTNGLVVGFDIVGAEDNGRSDLEFLAELGEGSDKIPLMLHAGETAWADDSLDPAGAVAPGENLYEAVLLGAKRIGHALALTKNPGLLSLVKKNNVCVELCPISNQILGFFRDLREHPGASLLKQGVHGVLASDDPGLYGTTLSMDFYQAWHAWGLRLADISQLIQNSLTCSGLNETLKNDYLRRWKTKWTNWVQRTRDMACSETSKLLSGFTMATSFTEVIPPRVPANTAADILVINRNISLAICPPNGKILCRFGEQSSGIVTGRYLGPNELLCTTPMGRHSGVDTVYISIDGTHFASTGHGVQYS